MSRSLTEKDTGFPRYTLGQFLKLDKCFHSFTRATMKRITQTGWLKQQTFIVSRFQRMGARDGGLISPKASFLCMQVAFLIHPHVAFSLFVHSWCSFVYQTSSSYQDNSQIGLGPPIKSLILTLICFKGPISKYSHVLRQDWGLGLPHTNLQGEARLITVLKQCMIIMNKLEYIIKNKENLDSALLFSLVNNPKMNMIICNTLSIYQSTFIEEIPRGE